MKKLFPLLLILMLSCSDDNNKPKSELDKLPPATQTGENTVGCLLDGKAFLPGKIFNPTNCFYQYVDGEFYFVMAFTGSLNSVLVTVSVGTQKLSLIEGGTYNLIELTDNQAYGGYVYGTFENYTSNVHSGELFISKLDSENGIVSGTFWFDIVDYEGNLREIREGRFDMEYSN
ncbi:MAG TPA: hypothetical protein PLA69_05385 [Flavobacterium sp.]|nr:hypothetical protein [Flavobacterium sp.]